MTQLAGQTHDSVSVLWHPISSRFYFSYLPLNSQRHCYERNTLVSVGCLLFPLKIIAQLVGSTPEPEELIMALSCVVLLLCHANIKCKNWPTDEA